MHIQHRFFHPLLQQPNRMQMRQLRQQLLQVLRLLPARIAASGDSFSASHQGTVESYGPVSSPSRGPPALIQLALLWLPQPMHS